MKNMENNIFLKKTLETTIVPVRNTLTFIRIIVSRKIIQNYFSYENLWETTFFR
jgi:hypothetical protein